jgi:hypothetical protein
MKKPVEPVPIRPAAPGTRHTVRGVIGGRTVEFTVAVECRMVETKANGPADVIEMPKRDGPV